MAELGHPIIGPQSMSKLTKSELRIYAEGFYVEAERKRKAREEDSDMPEGHSERKREREDDMLADMDAKAKDAGLVPAES